MKSQIHYLKLLFVLCMLNPMIIHAEFKDEVEKLIQAYDTTTVDSLRMIRASSIAQKVMDIDLNLALKYLVEANELMSQGVEYSSEKSSRSKTKCRLYNLMSIAYSRAGEISKGIEFRIKSLETARDSKDIEMEGIALMNLAAEHEMQGNYQEALRYQKMSLELSLNTNNNYQTGLGYGNIGSIFEKLGNADSALYYYKSAVPHLLKIENNKEAKFGAMGWIYNNLGNIFRNNNLLDSAYHYFLLSKQYREEINHNLGKTSIYCDLAEMHRKLKNTDSAFYYVNKSIAIANEYGFLDYLNESYKLRSEMYKERGKYREALGDYTSFISFRDSMFNLENGKNLIRQSMAFEHQLAQLSDSMEFARKEAVLTERTEKQKLGLVASAGGLILLLALATSIYKGKKRSDELLLNILPEETARELKQKGHADAKLIDEVTVLFTDFKGFTSFTEKMGPKELVEDLNECFSAFDLIVEKHGLEKIKTIGDAYMAAGGLPSPNNTHASDAVKAAFEMREFIESGKIKKLAANLPYFEIRIGIHTGPVVAGIVGIKKFQYDIWGDTVNTASRLESCGDVGKINISQSTCELVKDQYNCEYRGEIEAKGKGKVKMYYVENRA